MGNPNPSKSVKKATLEAEKQAEQKRTTMKKEAVLVALRASMGVVTAACESVQINRDTFYEWCRIDPAFKKRVDEMPEIALDFTESKLLKNIEKGDTQAIIFHLKTKGKSRGFTERQEIDHTSKGEPIVMGPDLSKLSYEQLKDLLHKGPTRKANRKGDQKA